MTSVEQAYEFMTTLTDLAGDATHDETRFVLDFDLANLDVQDYGDKIGIACKAVPAIDGVVLSEENFLQTLDALQASVLEVIDGVKRLPEGYSYPDDFLYKGGN